MDSKELDAGREVELECVDSNRFLGAHTTTNKLILRQESLIVESVFDNYGIFLKGELKGGANNYIHRKEFECFRIKRPTATFDDLVDVAYRALKDGFIEDIFIKRNKNEEFLVTTTGFGYKYKTSDYCSHIKHIKSLYTETFVIESVEDIARTKRKATIELTNGNTFIVDTASDNYLIPACSFDRLTLLVLKGATVTQRRS